MTSFETTQRGRRLELPTSSGVPVGGGLLDREDLIQRRDRPIRLHPLRLADEVDQIRARDLRFTERETRELRAASGISLSDTGAAALYQRTEGWAGGLRLAVISLSGHADPERFVAEFSG